MPNGKSYYIREIYRLLELALTYKENEKIVKEVIEIVLKLEEELKMNQNN